jgi:DNA-binding transcriptional regulator YiaG
MKLSYAARIKRARHLLGLTQHAASQKWGVTQQTISKWERGQARPTGLYRKLLERVLTSIENPKSK